MSDRLILGLDNSTDFLNLVLGTEERLIEERHSSAERHSSEVLPLRVARLLADHGATACDLSALAVTLGPGSFTGVRVALAFCKGLVAALAIPLFGIPTHDVLALPLAFMEGYRLCPVIDAKKGEVFFALYEVKNGEPIRIDGPRALKPDKVAASIQTPCLCFGTGAKLCAPFLSGVHGVRIIDSAFQRVSGEALLKATWAAQKRGDRYDDVKLIYGRKSEAEIKFNVTLP